MDYRSISEYIENLPLEESLCRGYKPDDVYEVICNISSMYNALLSEAYKKLDEANRSACQGEEKTLTEAEGEQETPADEAVNDETMLTDKEMQKLKRTELLEILLEQSKEKDALKEQLAEKEKKIALLNQKLQSKEINMKQAGTMAEAAFRLNGVYEAADKAAKQYLDNLQMLAEKEKRAYAEKEQEVLQRCQESIQETYKKCDQVKEDTVKTCKALIAATEKKCKDKEAETTEKCNLLLQQAREHSSVKLDDVSASLKALYSSQKGIEEIVSFLK